MNSNYIVICLLLILVVVYIYILIHEKKEIYTKTSNVSVLCKCDKLKEIEYELNYLDAELNNISLKMQKLNKSYFSYLELFENSINKNLSTLNKKLQDTNIELIDLKENVHTKLNSIKREISYIEDQLDLIDYKLENLKKETMIFINNSELLEKMYELINKLEDISDEISIMSDWIKTSNINNTILKKYLPGTYYNLSKCINKSYADIACISFLLYNIDLLNYSSDNITYKKEDILVSPLEFMRTKKGDCEDFCFFYLKLIKYLKNNYNISYLTLLEYSENNICKIYEKDNKYWYIENCIKKIIDLTKYKYVYVYCYGLNKTFGHCIDVICKEPIVNSTEILFTDKCIFFEPQNYGVIIKKEIVNGKVYLYSDPKERQQITSSITLLNENIYCNEWKPSILLCVRFNHS